MTDYAHNILVDAKYTGDYEIIITDIVLLTICLEENRIEKILNYAKKEKEIYKILKDEDKTYDDRNVRHIPLFDVLESNDIPASATIKMLRFFIDFNKNELHDYLEYMVNEVLSLRGLKDHASINWLNNLIKFSALVHINKLIVLLFFHNLVQHFSLVLFFLLFF